MAFVDQGAPLAGLDVLQHVEGQDEIEGPVLERQPLAGHDQRDVGVVEPVDVGAHDLGAGAEERPCQGNRPAADVEDPNGRPRPRLHRGVSACTRCRRKA